ncbi:unnamed protein product [Mytilus coruscus]|uniref:C-type lectin domain-containing protein n=1 Tax=Mytilus coruscus TaxID=42192 RepID=A0A6J8BY72_MYTCO|nr:unnamed protein product [Mytilus coruscus]
MNKKAWQKCYSSEILKEHTSIVKLQLHYNYKFSLNLTRTFTSSTVIQCARECIGKNMTGSASYQDKDCSCHSNVFTSKDNADVITGAVYIKPVPYMEADTKECPDDYYYYGNISCFRFFDTLVNHGTAVQVCQQQNAALIKIDSDDKQEYVNQYFDWHPAELVHIQGYRGLEDDSWFLKTGMR